MQGESTGEAPARIAPSAGASRGLGDLLLALALGLLALATLVATSRDHAMVWDEGHTVRRDRILADWFGRVLDPPTPSARREAFTPRELERSWPFSREEPDGHPPFYAELGVAGWWLTHDQLDPLTAYRFGSMALTSATLVVVFLHLAARHGRVAALTGAGCLLLMPRVFSHAHYAHYDMPVTCLWLLAQVAFCAAASAGRRAWIWGIAFGILIGLAMATKFTGWFAALPAILWVMGVEGPRLLRRLAAPGGMRGIPPGLRALLVGLPVALVVLVGVQPAWWADPITGARRLLESNLTRAQTKPIPTLYLGRIYAFSLPWHNTLVLTGVTTPLMVLGLGALGIARGVVARGRAADPAALLWVLSWGVLMVARALPSAPGHDGVRLILPSVASLGVLAGMGVSVVARGRARIALALALLALGECGWGIARLYPYTLSYYNAAIGGLPGAERAGFEITYYWDTLADPFLAWSREQARANPDGLELRFPTTLVTIPYLREWGRIPASARVVGFDATTQPYYVLQRRRGVYYPYDWWLEYFGAPVFVARREGVDLLRVYPFSESFKAYAAMKDAPIPAYLRN